MPLEPVPGGNDSVARGSKGLPEISKKGELAGHEIKISIDSESSKTPKPQVPKMPSPNEVPSNLKERISDTTPSQTLEEQIGDISQQALSNEEGSPSSMEEMMEQENQFRLPFDFGDEDLEAMFAGIGEEVPGQIGETEIRTGDRVEQEGEEEDWMTVTKENIEKFKEFGNLEDIITLAFKELPIDFVFDVETGEAKLESFSREDQPRDNKNEVKVGELFPKNQILVIKQEFTGSRDVMKSLEEISGMNLNRFKKFSLDTDTWRRFEILLDDAITLMQEKEKQKAQDLAAKTYARPGDLLRTLSRKEQQKTPEKFFEKKEESRVLINALILAEGFLSKFISREKEKKKTEQHDRIERTEIQKAEQRAEAGKLEAHTKQNSQLSSASINSGSFQAYFQK